MNSEIVFRGIDNDFVLDVVTNENGWTYAILSLVRSASFWVLKQSGCAADSFVLFDARA